MRQKEIKDASKVLDKLEEKKVATNWDGKKITRQVDLRGWNQELFWTC